MYKIGILVVDYASNVKVSYVTDEVMNAQGDNGMQKLTLTLGM